MTTQSEREIAATAYFERLTTPTPNRPFQYTTKQVILTTTSAGSPSMAAGIIIHRTDAPNVFSWKLETPKAFKTIFGDEAAKIADMDIQGLCEALDNGLTPQSDGYIEIHDWHLCYAASSDQLIDELYDGITRFSIWNR